MYYNVWMLQFHRWTLSSVSNINIRGQDPDNPARLSLEQATSLCRRLSDGDTSWCEVRPLNGYKPRKPRKVIPDIPLDPTLPILEAGHLQDRARKRG